MLIAAAVLPAFPAAADPLYLPGSVQVYLLVFLLQLLMLLLLILLLLQLLMLHLAAPLANAVPAMLCASSTLTAAAPGLVIQHPTAAFHCCCCLLPSPCVAALLLHQQAHSKSPAATQLASRTCCHTSTKRLQDVLLQQRCAGP
jgi:hypothetical protein